MDIPLQRDKSWSFVCLRPQFWPAADLLVIGDFKFQLPPVPGFICAWHFDPDGGAENLKEADLEFHAKSGFGWLWIHLNLTDKRCLKWLNEQLGFSQNLTTEFTEPSLRQYFGSQGEFMIGQLNDFRREFDEDSSEHAWLRFIASEKFLITGRNRALQSAERLRKDLSRGMHFAEPSLALVHIISNYPDRLDSLQHQLMDELEIIEDHVLDERHRGERKRLMLARRETAQLHRHLRALRRALQTGERVVAQFPPGLATVINRLGNLDQDFEVMEARARFFHDEIDAKLASETNRQLYILSALTAAFLPPTLVAGLFGMNLPGMPWSGSGWGFWLAIGLCVSSSAAVWFFLWAVSRR
jgi:zinc transporter